MLGFTEAHFGPLSIEGVIDVNWIIFDVVNFEEEVVGVRVRLPTVATSGSTLYGVIFIDFVVTTLRITLFIALRCRLSNYDILEDIANLLVVAQHNVDIGVQVLTSMHQVESDTHIYG